MFYFDLKSVTSQDTKKIVYHPVIFLILNFYCQSLPDINLPPTTTPFRSN